MDNQITIKRALIENTLKHLSIIVSCFILSSYIYNELGSTQLSNLGEFLMLISIFLVTACFANFASSYELTDISKNWMRILSQFASLINLLLIAMLLLTMMIAIDIVYNKMFDLASVFSILLYFGIIVYDYWDFLRCFVRT